MPNFSPVIAADADGYYNPVTLDTIPDDQVTQLVQSAHAAGLLVQGVDTRSDSGSAAVRNIGTVTVTLAKPNWWPLLALLLFGYAAMRKSK